MTHKSEDYKISAVKYYLKNKDNFRKTCKIFDCKKSTLQRWIQRYNSTKNLTRRNRKPLDNNRALNFWFPKTEKRIWEDGIIEIKFVHIPDLTETIIAVDTKDCKHTFAC
jgi:transposase